MVINSFKQACHMSPMHCNHCGLTLQSCTPQSTLHAVSMPASNGPRDAACSMSQHSHELRRPNLKICTLWWQQMSNVSWSVYSNMNNTAMPAAQLA